MTNTKPLFSILIVNYNHGEFIEDAIKSILNQNCNDYELIIVDGGSTDNSVEVIKKYDKDIKWWVSEPDSGQSNAFNKGFNKASGQFYFWLNADDLLLPNTLKFAKSYILNHKDCKWIAGNMILMDKKMDVLKCSKGPVFNSYLVKGNTPYVYGPSSIFHESLFQAVGGFDEALNYTMDTDLWMKFVNLGFRFDRLNHYCWAFRMHEESKTSHAFENQSNKAFASERIKIAANNHFHKTTFSTFLLKFFKIFTGCYIVSSIDTIRLKGKKVNSI